MELHTRQKKRLGFYVASWLVAIIVLLAPASSALAGFLYVGVEGYGTIQGAIEASNPGDTILVEAGTYVENIDFLGKAITLKSVSGSSLTIIDGNASGPVVTFSTSESNDTVLDGFTLRNGNGNSLNQGGGIYCNNAAPTITNCIIKENSATYGGGIYYKYYNWSGLPPMSLSNCSIDDNSATYGGGIYFHASSPLLSNCTISSNTANYGGGFYCLSDSKYFSTSPRLTDCSISNNSAIYKGGAFYCNTPENYNLPPESMSSPVLTNCTISDNSAGNEPINGDGGAFYCTYSSPEFSNCNISGNVASGNGGAIYCNWSSAPKFTNCSISDNLADMGGVIFSTSSSPTFTDCDMKNNSADSGSVIYSKAASITVNNCNFTGNNGNGGMIHTLDSHLPEFSLEFSNCVISDNTVGPGAFWFENSSSVVSNCIIRGNSGRGAYCSRSSYPQFLGCIITGNYVGGPTGGGGIAFFDSDAALINCTISGNLSDVSGGGLLSNGGGVVAIANSILWNNAPDNYNFLDGAGSLYDIYIIAYSVVDPSYELLGANNINGDPLFIDARSPAMAPTSEGDYHLKVDSPCRTLGWYYYNEMPEYDIDGENRLTGTVDIGADEFFPTYEEYVVAADFTATSSATSDLTVTLNASEASCSLQIKSDASNADLGVGVVREEVEKPCDYVWDTTGATVGGNGSDVLVVQYGEEGTYDATLTMTMVDDPATTIDESTLNISDTQNVSFQAEIVEPPVSTAILDVTNNGDGTCTVQGDPGNAVFSTILSAWITSVVSDTNDFIAGKIIPCSSVVRIKLYDNDLNITNLIFFP